MKKSLNYGKIIAKRDIYDKKNQQTFVASFNFLVKPEWTRSTVISYTRVARFAVGRNKKKRADTSTLLPLVGLSGLEPPTPTLSGWCSNRLSYNPILNFICVKLTFAPFCNFTSAKNVKRRWCACKMGINLGSKFVVEVIGFEPMTPCLQGRCSSQLSYTPTECSNILTK